MTMPTPVQLHRRGRPGVLHRPRRRGEDHPADRQRRHGRHRAVYTGQEFGLLGHRARPGLRHQQPRLPLLLADGRGTSTGSRRFTVQRQHADLASRSDDPRRPGAAQRVLPRGRRRWSSTSDGNLYLATGDNTNPFDSDGYAPIDERAGRSAWDAQRTVGQHQRPERQGAADQAPQADGTTPSRQATCSPRGTRTRPGPRSTPWASATRSASASTRAEQQARSSPTTARTPAPRAPTRGPDGRVEWNILDQPGNYGWPYCVGANTPTTTTTSPPAPSGATFNCAAPVNDSPNNTGLTNLPPAIAAVDLAEQQRGHHRNPGDRRPAARR